MLIIFVTYSFVLNKQWVLISGGRGLKNAAQWIKWRGENGKYCMLNQIGEERVKMYGGLHFCLFWSKWLKLTNFTYTHCKKTIKTFHSKLEWLFLYRFIYAIQFERMSLSKLPLHKMHQFYLISWWDMFVICPIFLKKKFGHLQLPITFKGEALFTHFN